ncbi:hypothetical protein GCM10009543_36470 [Leifsonia naganoensis]
MGYALPGSDPAGTRVSAAVRNVELDKFARSQRKLQPGRVARRGALSAESIAALRYVCACSPQRNRT